MNGVAALDGFSCLCCLQLRGRKQPAAYALNLIIVIKATQGMGKIIYTCHIYRQTSAFSLQYSSILRANTLILKWIFELSQTRKIKKQSPFFDSKFLYCSSIQCHG